MKKFNFLLTAVFVLFFWSCTVETVVDEVTAKKNVTLTINTEPLTKAYEVPQAGLITPITSMIVYFLDNDPTDSKVVTYFILNSDQIKAVSSGYKFTNLESRVNSMYVVANLDETQTSDAISKTSLSAIKAITIGIASQQNKIVVDESNNKLVKVVMAKEGTLVDTKTPANNGNAEYTSSIELVPLVARIEIQKITCDVDKTIGSFELEAIYVNNFYKSLTVDATTHGDTYQVTSLTAENTFSSTTYKNYGLYDEPISPKTILDLPSASNVYGYQVFPVNSILTKDVPHIILKVKITSLGTATENISVNKEYYVNISAYKFNSSTIPDYTSTNFKSFEAGNVYSINTIALSEKNLMKDPFGGKNVTATVTVKAWGSVILDPDYGY